MSTGMKLSLCKIALNALCVMAMTPVDIYADSMVQRSLSSSTVGSLEIIADSIDYRSDVTRIYCRLSGKAHTSSRIDSVSVSMPVRVSATDIDGVDFKRWFQWEDDGVIPVEIDFPPMKPVKNMTINVLTPRGSVVWTIERK